MLEAVLIGIVIYIAVGWIHYSARCIRANRLIARFERLRFVVLNDDYYEPKLDTLIMMAKEDLLSFWHLQSFESHESQCTELLKLEREINERTTRIRN